MARLYTDAMTQTQDDLQEGFVRLPDGRVLDGRGEPSWDYTDDNGFQTWSNRGILDGEECWIEWQFDTDEIEECEELDQFPWDVAHLLRITVDTGETLEF